MRTAYKCRAYPAPEQASVLNRTFGCVRVVWNRTLAWRHQRYYGEHVKTGFTQASAFLTAMKATEELAWLNEVPSVPLQQAIRHQQIAYTSFFARRARYPRFKSRNGRQSAEYTRSGFRYRDGALRLAKMGTPLDFVWSWPDIDPAAIEPTTVTVSRDPCGRWYVSFAVEVAGPGQLPAAGRAAGVDLGIKDFAVTSDGEKIANPQKLARRGQALARYQRRLARCRKGSANRAKAKAKVARAHRKVRASRADFLHRASTRLVRGHDVIVVEGPERGGHGPQPVAGQVDQRLRVGHFPPDAGVQGRQSGTAPDRGRPLVPQLQDLLGMRAPARIPEPQHQDVAVPVLRHPARPGHQRREEHTCGRSCRSWGQPRRCLRS